MAIGDDLTAVQIRIYRALIAMLERMVDAPPQDAGQAGEAGRQAVAMVRLLGARAHDDLEGWAMPTRHLEWQRSSGESTSPTEAVATHIGPLEYRTIVKHMTRIADQLDAAEQQLPPVRARMAHQATTGAQLANR